MTPEQRHMYNRLCKIQGSLFKLIGNIESIKIDLLTSRTSAGGRSAEEQKQENNSIAAGA